MNLVTIMPVRQNTGAPPKGLRLQGSAPGTPPDCDGCKWNVSNRCQHWAQGCAPCRQGIGLNVMRLTPGFKCPL